ncbi:hypothetical protein OWV82_005189 [Melia azedarach]|uniref:Uncharacterized protein n=1 Tax=Melia azedarach TaxID=155640 RepID=A0ACC1YRQ2_MELAZ|nr:hypothetical protein OWV82_005189 [Melia azedarach]
MKFSIYVLMDFILALMPCFKINDQQAGEISILSDRPPRKDKSSGNGGKINEDLGKVKPSDGSKERSK